MSTKSDLQAKLAKKEASLAIAEATYDKLLADPKESYRFDSGEGSQSSKNRKLSDVKKQIDDLEAEIEQIKRRLNHKGLTSIRLNRKSNRCL